MAHYLIEYDRALDWLRLLEFPNTGRFFQYRKLLARIFVSGEEGRYHLPESEIINCAPILHNTYELICISKAFHSGSANSVFHDKVQHAIKGPRFLDDETPLNDSCTARNYMFELFMAAIFKNAGHAVEFMNGCDFKAVIRRKCLYVECKRIRSIRKLDFEIRDASRKIASLCGADAHGLICINVTPLLSNASIIVGDEAEAQKHMNPIGEIPLLRNLMLPSCFMGILYYGSFVLINSQTKRISFPFRIGAQWKSEKGSQIIRPIFEIPFFQDMV